MADEKTKKDAMSEYEMVKKVLEALHDTKVAKGTKVIIECTNDEGGSEKMSLHKIIHGTPSQLIKMLYAAMCVCPDFKKLIIATAQLSEVVVSHVEIQEKTNEEEN